MLTRLTPRFRLSLMCIAAAVGLVIPGRSFCQSTQPAESRTLAPTAVAQIWKTLQERTPFAYSLPLPPPKATAIDGLYVKQEPLTAEHVHCLRCPDWLYEGGLWKIKFDRGVYRVLHEEAGWRTIGSYALAADRLILFNDPCCIEGIGVYAWKLERGTLTLQVIDDPCAIQLRGKNLAHLPWQRCQPPNIEAAVTDHWEKPTGCP
jgi:hypothetical protein